ncbi:MAG: Uma2 family endonuclease [Pseudonocardia sp.]|nr:Uma2 family endonuclease [Pseudonocardia sp.]
MTEVGSALPTHEGAWTEEAYLALPHDRRIELVDGSLLVAPSTDDRHARAVTGVRTAVGAALPDGLQVLGPVPLRLSPGRILVPDLVVTARPPDGAGPDGAGPDGAGSENGVRDSSVALLVIDVVGRGNGVADRWFKPQLYAGSRIPYALLVDHDEPFATGNMLIGGRYHEYAFAEPGGVLSLQEPFALELALDMLTDPAPEPDPDRPVPA